MTTYERPIKATLHVHLDNGETWEATADDYKRFGLDYVNESYYRFDKRLSQILFNAGLIERMKDVTEAELNAVRYLAETAICFPDLLDHPHQNGWANVADLERTLQAARVAGGDQ